MTSATEISTSPLDPRLLARMTGRLGDDKTIGKICGDLGLVFAEFLPDVLQSETGLSIAFGYSGFESGLYEDLVIGLGTSAALSSCSLRNWANEFAIACESPIIIALMEALLGALPATMMVPVPRSLSTIELDLAASIFEKIAGVLCSAVKAQGGFEPTCAYPVNSGKRLAGDVEDRHVFAAAINMTLTIGPVTSTFTIIVPQQTLLKTNVVLPKGIGQGKRANGAWTEKLEEQVRRSTITVEARIKLESLTLDTVSRLQPGDVIPFLDRQDVRVEVNGNGRDLYICEFGRSGSKYTVRVKDTCGSDRDILNHLMS